MLGLITSDVLITSGMDEDLFNKVQIEEIYQATPFTDKSDVDYQKWLPKESFGSDYVNLTELRKQKTSFLDSLLGQQNVFRKPSPDKQERSACPLIPAILLRPARQYSSKLTSRQRL